MGDLKPDPTKIMNSAKQDGPTFNMTVGLGLSSQSRRCSWTYGLRGNQRCVHDHLMMFDVCSQRPSLSHRNLNLLLHRYFRGYLHESIKYNS